MIRSGPGNSQGESTLRAQATGTGGREYWRSLEELADTEAFQERLHREFPEGASEWRDPLGRRRFLKLMGASLALSGFVACTRQPLEKLAPYVRAPEERAERVRTVLASV